MHMYRREYKPRRVMSINSTIILFFQFSSCSIAGQGSVVAKLKGTGFDPQLHSLPVDILEQDAP